MALSLHEAQPMKHTLVALLALAMGAAACSGSNSTSSSAITTPATSITETFAGTVQPNFGTDFHNFNVAQTGTLSVTLTAAGPPSTIYMGIGIGTPSASTCAVIQADSTIAPAGVTAQLSGTLAAGAYCVQVYDVGNASTVI